MFYISFLFVKIATISFSAAPNDGLFLSTHCLFQFKVKQRIYESEIIKEKMLLLPFIEKKSVKKDDNYEGRIIRQIDKLYQSKLMEVLPDNIFLCELENLNSEDEFLRVYDEYLNEIVEYYDHIKYVRHLYKKRASKKSAMYKEYKIYKKYLYVSKTKDNQSDLIKHINHTLIELIQDYQNNKNNIKIYKRIKRKLIRKYRNAKDRDDTKMDSQMPKKIREDKISERNIRNRNMKAGEYEDAPKDNEKKRVDNCEYNKDYMNELNSINMRILSIERVNKILADKIFVYIKFTIFAYFAKSGFDPFEILYPCLLDSEVLKAYNFEVKTIAFEIKQYITNLEDFVVIAYYATNVITKLQMRVFEEVKFPCPEIEQKELVL